MSPVPPPPPLSGPPPPPPPSLVGPPPPPPPSLVGPPPPPPPSLQLDKNNKISPAALRGISNSTSVRQCPKTSVQSAIKRLVNFHQVLSCHNFLCYHHPTTSRLQEGPQCGLVALSMATSSLTNDPEGILPDVIENLAKARGYTKQGEMFSVDDMAALASELLKNQVEVSVEEIDELMNNRNLLERLGGGDMFLVPYDCDFNHEPCLAHGKKAHWGLVTGFVMAVKMEINDIRDKAIQVDIDDENEQIFHLSELSQEGLSQLLNIVDNCDSHLLLLARQSKSLSLGAWRRDKLVKSCHDLKEIDPKREGEIELYQIPTGGIKAGLAGRMVHLSNRKI